MLTPKKILILRLSSLGDIFLTVPVLGSFDPGVELHWVVAKGFENSLEGNPKLTKIWIFDRSEGLSGLYRLARDLKSQNFDEIFDLHSILRTKLIRFFLWSFGWTGQWIKLKKPYLKRLGLILFKKFWPLTLRPPRMADLFFETIRAPKVEFLMDYLVSEAPPAGFTYQTKKYLTVMPSSLWKGKEWPTENYVELIKSFSLPVVVLGTSKDGASVRLSERLTERSILHFSAVGKTDLKETAWLIKNSRGFIGSDSGLYHLAEALQVQTHVFFGPTTTDFGFGPRNKSTVVLESDLWCRPCSKDGSYCFRLFKPHRCLSDLNLKLVKEKLGQLNA